MLELLTTEQFAAWFAALEDAAAEDVATALEVIGELGPERAPPGSRESLLWFEHAAVGGLAYGGSFAWDLEGWGAFLDYAKQVLAALESPRFTARLGRLDAVAAERALKLIRRIRREADPRQRWALKAAGAPAAATRVIRPENAGSELRQLYFELLEVAGFAVVDVPVHSRALREFSRRAPGPAFRLLYGVDAARKTALIVLGEWLDHSYYGDAVKRAERLWQSFLNGELAALEPAVLR